VITNVSDEPTAPIFRVSALRIEAIPITYFFQVLFVVSGIIHAG
jgi:hypothetical protein